MSADNGWIKLHRRVIDSCVFEDAALFQLFVYCILKANHKQTSKLWNGKMIELKPGQFITGRFKLATALNTNPNTIYKRLKRLEMLGKIRIESNNKNTLLTVIKYNTYQEVVTTKEQQSNNKVTTKEQQSNTDKNVKNDKNEKKRGEDHIPALISETSFQPKKLFADSEQFDFDTFQTQFTNHPDYNGYDARHYYGVMRDYSASNNKTSADWIAYTYSIVRRDNAKNQAVKLKPETIHEKAARLAREAEAV